MYSPEAGPRAACRGVTVGESLLHVGDARSLIERKNFQTRTLTIIKRPNGDLSASGMLYKVSRKLGCHDGDAPDVTLAEPLLRRGHTCEAPRFGNARALVNGH